MTRTIRSPTLATTTCQTSPHLEHRASISAPTAADMRPMIASPHDDGGRDTVTRAAADSLTEEGTELFRAERFLDAMARFERATQIYPDHALAWKGIGNVLLCMGRPNDAARAFDRAIGLRPESATALWGGAVAHADNGNREMAQDYL